MSDDRRVWDISWNLDEPYPVFPGDSPASLARTNYKQGYKTTELRLSSHSGTHMDFPRHFLPNGRVSSSFTLNLLMGEVEILSFKNEPISAEILSNHKISTQRVILKTNCQPDIFLTPDGAQHLYTCGVKVVGTDSLSIDGDETCFPNHRFLLDKGIIVIENLKLAEIKCGRYHLVCLPLPFADIDGSPCRALLFSRDKHENQ